MIGSVKARRAIGLLVLVLAALLALTAALGVPEAEAKKKKKKINVVQCADAGFECVGTDRKDRLVGTPGSENILGGEGNDVYQANGGNSFLIDLSVTSSDSYTAVDPVISENTIVIDFGGSVDFLDMGSFKALDDVTFTLFDDDLVLVLQDPQRVVRVDGQFGRGRIEKIRFANGTLTGTQAESLAREATPEEQTAVEDSLNEAQLRERPLEAERTSRDERSSEKETQAWRATSQTRAASE